MALDARRLEMALYSKALLDSLYFGALTPFLPAYSVHLGASPTQVSAIYACSTFAMSLSQVIWGYISDLTGRRRPYIVAGGLVSSTLLLPILFIDSPLLLLLIVTLHSVATSMTLPTFTSYSAEAIDPGRWRHFSSRVNSLSYVGWVVSTFVVGILSQFGLNGFHVGFALSLVSGLLGVLVFTVYCDEPLRGVSRHRVHDNPGSLEDGSRRKSFLQFVAISFAFNLFLSFAWPLFTITQTKILHFTYFHIGLLEAVSGLSGALGLLILSRWLVNLTLNRLLALSSSSLTLLPLFYHLAPEFVPLLLIHLATGITSAIYDSSVLAYILENSPGKRRGLWTAAYNFVAGSALFSGPIIAGILLENMASTHLLSEALSHLYIVSIMGKLITGILYITSR